MGTSFFREPVFLEAAVGFVGDRHFQQTFGEQRLDVAFVIQVGVGESGGVEEVGFGSGSARASTEDGGDLLTDCRTDLLTRYLKECGKDGGKQELDEGGGVPRRSPRPA